MFDLLAPEIQTAVACFLFQRGENAFISKNAHYRRDVEYGRLLTSGKWQDALECFAGHILGVRATSESYGPRARRMEELGLLMRGTGLPLPSVLIPEAERRSHIA
jgi:hypothetical protein